MKVAQFERKAVSRRKSTALVKQDSPLQQPWRNLRYINGLEPFANASIVNQKVLAFNMSRWRSTLDEEPCLIEHEEDDSDRDEDDEEDDEAEEVDVRNRFEEILRAIQDRKLNLRDAARLEQFEAQYGHYLGMISRQKTLLHLLIDDANNRAIDIYKPLVELLIHNHPSLLKEKDNDEKTPLYSAIHHRKRDKLVRLMCESLSKFHPRIRVDEILSIPCHSDNCLHVAIRHNLPPKLAIFLISQASEATLCAKDSRGNTPLHLAVEYKRCTDTQLEIVNELIKQCDKAIDERTNNSHHFSPYRYHEYTRAEDAKRTKITAKEGALRKMEEGGSVDGEGLAESDIGASKFKDSKAPKPFLAPKAQGGSVLGSKLGKLEPLRRAGMNSEAPSGEYQSYGGSGGASTSTQKNNGMVTPLTAEDPPNRGPTSRTGSWREEKLEGKALRSNTPVTGRERKKRKAKEEGAVTEKTARKISDLLKLHCLRTRKHDDALEFLYGRNKEKDLFFDLIDHDPYLEISEERIEEGLAHLKLEDVLQYVALPRIKLTKRPIPSKVSHKSREPDYKGRSDMIFMFNFLRRKGVERVIRVIVNDFQEPAHSDEAIEKAVKDLRIEVWDWQKIDLCTETILEAAPDVSEVSLYWSGNNAVLRGWSEPGGLKRLQKLKKVNLYVKQGLESASRTHINIKKFQECLTLLCPTVEVDVIQDYQRQKHDTKGGVAQEQVERHKWLTCMDEFADFIQNLEPPLRLQEQVTIALIDDGVDINEQSLHAKIVGGRSFCHRDKLQNLSRPHYITSSGHGTVMASLICRVCPKAQLYVIKLDESVGEHATTQITAESAAKAVREATVKKVHIIAMSWTIERTKDNDQHIKELESAIDDAANQGILMFCAASDQGIAQNNSFPAACGKTKHLFKIGAAEASGSAWKWLGDTDDVDFIFPGHKVVAERPKDAPFDKCATLTGSSVATAIAAGLAALVLYCVQLGALKTQTLDQQPGLGDSTVTMKDFEDMKGFERMKEAFLAIGTSPASKNKYIEVWNVFESAAKKAEGIPKERRLEIVTSVAMKLKTRKILE